MGRHNRWIISIFIFVLFISVSLFGTVKYDDEEQAVTPDWSWINNSCRQSICLNGLWDFMPDGKTGSTGKVPDKMDYLKCNLIGLIVFPGSKKHNSLTFQSSHSCDVV